MSFNLKWLLGDKGGASNEYLNALRGELGQYDQATAREFGPDAYRSTVANYSDNLDNSLAGADAAGIQHLGASGQDLGVGSGGTLMGYTRAHDEALNQEAVAQQQREGLRAALLARMQILGPLGNATYRPPTQGVLQQAAAAYGATQGIKTTGGQPQNGAVGQYLQEGDAQVPIENPSAAPAQPQQAVMSQGQPQPQANPPAVSTATPGMAQPGAATVGATVQPASNPYTTPGTPHHALMAHMAHHLIRSGQVAGNAYA